MPKIKVIDPNGVHFSGKILPVGSEHTIDKGPHLAAWQRFKQVEIVEEAAAPAPLAEKAPPPLPDPPPLPTLEAPAPTPAAAAAPKKK